MDIRKMDRQHLIALSMVALACTLSSSFVKRTRVITFKKFMTIQTSKADPPRLAFDEINLEESKSKNDWDLLKSKSGAPLLVGESVPQFAARSPAHSLRTRKVVLNTMAFTHAEVEKFQEQREWIQGLPAQAQVRLMEAQQKHGTLDEEWQTPSFQAQAAKKISEVRSELEAEEKASKIFVQAQLPDGSVKSEIDKADVAVRDAQSFALSGVIELKGLPPPTDPRWQMHVARYEDGVKLEDANIDLKKSTYTIQIPSMSGAIVAQITDTLTGEILGEGSLRLSEYNQAAKRKITIEKTSNYIASNFGNFYDHPTSIRAPSAIRQKPIATKVLFASLDAESRTDEAGLYRFEQVQKSSWGLIRTQAKGFYSGMHLVQSGKDRRHPLFPESMIKALRQIIEDQNLTSEVASNGSVVWGQVTQNGKALSGAQVRVEGLSNFKPVYFNSLLLPDSELKATGANGYFAFIDLPAGLQALTANFGTTNISHANIVVDDETVSVAELDSLIQTEKATLKVFDAFTGQPQTAMLDLQSLPEALEVKGFAEVNLPDLSRLSLMKVTPQESIYSESLQLYEDSMDSLHVPLIRTDWLQSVMAVRKISSTPGFGVIVGFVPTTDFEVYLGHEPNFPKDQIVYFDPQGQLVPHGVPGGG
ncbi:MAG: carboxypeptidase-like regulatory domain-containing protein, partial [Pseudobdellovibrionaceae bacterium]